MINSPKTVKPLLVAIGGPTAVGKTAVAMELASRWKTEIISADSRQVFKELQIGTAKPTSEELSRVPHHFISEVSIREDYSVARFEREAMQRLEEIWKDHDIALVCGGSGLYFRALLEGMDAIPDVSPGVLKKLEDELRADGLAPLALELQQADPEYADQADLQNSRRVIRALSVFRQCGKPFSAFRKGKQSPRNFQSLCFCLTLPREELYARIERRVDAMLDKGLAAEARMLHAYQGQRAMRTVGYQEFHDEAYKDLGDEQIGEIIKRNSRRYAKRQLTWFRNQGNWQMIEMGDDVVDSIEQITFAAHSFRPS